MKQIKIEIGISGQVSMSVEGVKDSMEAIDILSQVISGLTKPPKSNIVKPNLIVPGGN
jgi:hypothetical protein